MSVTSDQNFFCTVSLWYSWRCIRTLNFRSSSTSDNRISFINPRTSCASELENVNVVSFLSFAPSHQYSSAQNRRDKSGVRVIPLTTFSAFSLAVNSLCFVLAKRAFCEARCPAVWRLAIRAIALGERGRLRTQSETELFATPTRLAISFTVLPSRRSRIAYAFSFSFMNPL